MSVAQTAELIVRIIGQDALTPAVATAEGSLGSLSTTSAVAAKSVGLVETAATGMGNALNHAKGFLSNLISGPLGMIGLGAAAFTVGGALKSGIDTANEMAATLEKLTAITGDSAESLSALIAVGDKYGISQQQIISSASFAEKTIGKLADTMSGKGKDATTKLVALDKEFGISLVDAKGHAVDFETELSRVADYYTSNASAASKATLAATLFGRGYQALIPILKLGSQGIADAEAAATALGLTLTGDNVVALQKYQAAMRDAGEAIGGLKLQLALDLIPDLTKLADTVRLFVTDHRTDIQAFFQGAIKAGEELGGALVAVGSKIVDVWNAIPGPMRDLLIQALIGNKVIKTVFGINILGSVEGVVAGWGSKLFGSLIGSIFGKTIATPVVNVDGAVVNVGGVGGALAGAAGAGEAATGAEAAGGAGALETIFGGGALAVLAPLAVAAIVPLALNALINSDPAKTGAQDLAARQQIAAGRGLNPANVPTSFTGRNANALPAGTNITDYGKTIAQSVQKSADDLTAIKQDSIADVRLGDAMLAEQKRATAHQASERTIAQIAGSNHDFLTLFRSGNAKSAVKLFPAEYNYLSTVSAQTKSTATYVSGLKQDITALQNAEVTATNTQKTKLAADIVALQNLVKLTTAAVNAVGAAVKGSSMTGGKGKDDINVGVTATVTAKQNSAASTQYKQGGGPGAKAI